MMSIGDGAFPCSTIICSTTSSLASFILDFFMLVNLLLPDRNLQTQLPLHCHFRCVQFGDKETVMYTAGVRLFARVSKGIKPKTVSFIATKETLRSDLFSLTKTLPMSLERALPPL
jgi:hypothetical protein